MPEVIKDWILGLVGAALITAVAMALTPEGRVKKVVALVCGFVTIIALIKPLAGFDYDAFAKNIARSGGESTELPSGLADENKNLTRLIIEEKCSAYILDKGAALGITDLKAAVTAKWSGDGYWYPYKVELTTDAGDAARGKLAGIIEADLGVAPDKLTWRTNDEK